MTALTEEHIAEGEPLLRREHEPLERVVFLCERGHVEILAEDPGAAALSLSEAESIVQGATVVPGGYHARRIEALRAAVLADGSVQA